ncbi:hypothetical protein AbaMCR54_01015 [Acinetobacter baumannii]|uniref:Uncharacterized protein n=2 Tax=Acinetobacter baumannii TaxID=470 RepID=A0A7X1SM61_ACIBA|nr:hypothetical protein [Acinetobacter baumannii]MBC6802365.1 hypothetical protein [Acinetobacter baumannii]MBC6815972.1 hypothetical protein [Acinetobacter baumannii]MQR51748.1 hypothetical protein [Acinetobacter baumannii]PPC43682.1 hypothetical protein AbaMCR54_01015 [Acinetobacter baumannii]
MDEGTKKLIFLRFSKPRNKYFFPCKTKHRPYVTLANFPIKDPAHAGIFLSHTTHLTMTPLKALQDKDFSDFLGSQKRVQKNGLFLE